MIVLYCAVHNLKKVGKGVLLQAWLTAMTEQNLVPFDYVHVSNVIRWFKMNPKFYPDLTFKIFVDEAKFIYERRASILPDQARVCYLHYSTPSKMWRYIFNIQAFFNLRKTNQKYCQTCNLFHDRRAKDGRCPWLNFEVDAEQKDGKLSYRVQTNHKAMAFADTEAMLPKQGDKRKHILSHVGVLSTWNENVIDYNHWQTYEPEDDPEIMVNNMIKQLVDDYELLDMHATFREFEELQHCDDCNRRSKRFYSGKSMATGEMVEEVCNWCWSMIHGIIFVYLHNLASYDNLLILSALVNADGVYVSNENLIAKAINKWEAFTVKVENSMYSFVFKDSFKLIPGSLAGLVDEFWKAGEKTVLGYPDNRLKSKGAFPYEWFDSHAKLYEPLPRDKENWWNELTQTYIDMEAALSDFAKNDFHNLGEYMLFYLENDCILLAEVFFAARRGIRNVLPFDLSYFHSLPSLSLYCAKLSTGADVGKCFYIHHKDIQKFFFSNVRGGVTQATIPRVNLDGYFDSGELEYVDFASLYPSAMSWPLSIAKSVFEVKDSVFDVLKNFMMSEVFAAPLRAMKPFVFHYQDKGFFALCTFEYPKELHDRDWMLPLIERRNPLTGGLINDFLPVTQLFSDRRIEFLIHAGLKLVDVKRIFTFDSSPFLRPYIHEMYTNRVKLIDEGKKIAATNCKLLMNSLYGKTVEDPRKYKDVKIVEITQNCTQRSEKWSILNEKYMIVAKGADVDMTSVPSLGFHILENSKCIFYEAWHELNCFFNGRQVIDLPDLADWAIARGLNMAEHGLQILHQVETFFNEKVVPVFVLFGQPDIGVAMAQQLNQIRHKLTGAHAVLENLGWYTTDYTMRLVYCDTDSFILHAPHFSASNFWGTKPQDEEMTFWQYLCKHFPHRFNAKKKELGKLDREMEGIREVIALGSKNYYIRAVKQKESQNPLREPLKVLAQLSSVFSWLFSSGKTVTAEKEAVIALLDGIQKKHGEEETIEVKKLKGVTMYKDKLGNAIITRQTYVNAIMKHQTMIVKQYRIERKKFELYGISFSKLALSGQNNKRIVVNEFLTLPYGYEGEKFKHVMYD